MLITDFKNIANMLGLQGTSCKNEYYDSEGVFKTPVESKNGNTYSIYELEGIKTSFEYQKDVVEYILDNIDTELSGENLREGLLDAAKDMSKDGVFGMIATIAEELEKGEITFKNN